MTRLARTLAGVALGAAAGMAACRAPENTDGADAVVAENLRAGRTVVLWISVDGMRPDYVDRASTPFFDRMIAEGMSSRELLPVFPSLTFPSHVSQATGVPVSRHGITGNNFYDAATDESHSYPWDSALLEAEPIWLTAARQGVRTAVLDWPLSHAQQGDVTATYFGERYDPRLSDQQRLENILETWTRDSNAEPLRLVMGYVVGPDAIGHRFGPDAPETLARFEETDQLLGRFLDGVLQLWEKTMRPEDRLYFLLTTDHGMMPVEKLVSIDALPSQPLPEQARLITGGNAGHIFLNKIVEPERERLKIALLEDLRRHPFLRAYARETLPEHLAYSHPTRAGDIVLILDPGHAFNRTRRLAIYDVLEAGPRGMHGYDPAASPEMRGLMILWRHPEPFGGETLGPVESLQLHPAVAKLLGIRPADRATAGSFF